jgi:hypothetical protein
MYVLSSNLFPPRNVSTSPGGSLAAGAAPAPVAQRIEQRTSNPKAAGSNPAGRTPLLIYVCPRPHGQCRSGRVTPTAGRSAALEFACDRVVAQFRHDPGGRVGLKEPSQPRGDAARHGASCSHLLSLLSRFQRYDRSLSFSVPMCAGQARYSSLPTGRERASGSPGRSRVYTVRRRGARNHLGRTR